MTGGPAVLTPDVLVIGGGPAGLTAAEALAGRLGPGSVLVLDREADPGGVPRHCAHRGFGVRDLHRFLTGPAYAGRLAERAAAAGADVRTRATVTGWAGERRVEVTSPEGRVHVEARAVVLATGARERSRAARLIPGDRPAGVYTTGHLQNAVHLHGRSAGRRAVVVGAELVSWSAVLTLRSAGCATALMTTTHARPEVYAPVALAGHALLRVPVATRTRVVSIMGRGRVEAVEIEHLDGGARARVPCDTVVLTGDWIPDHELARSAGLELDGGTRGPLVDTALRTSRPGVFAAGNVLHPVDTADVAALDGRHVAAQVMGWLSGAADPGPPSAAVRLIAGERLRWLAPGVLRPDGPPPPRGRFLAWPDAAVRLPRVRVTQDGEMLTERALPWPASPGRVLRIPASVLDGVRPDRGPATVSLG